MAYVDRHSQQNRGPILVAIAALHAGVIYALVTGLAGFVPDLVPETRTVGTNIRLPPPPPTPDPQPTAKPDPRPTSTTSSDAGGTVITTTTTSTDPTNGGTDLIGGSGSGGDGTFPGPETKPTETGPVYPPKLARPIGKPGLWVTPNDYPSSDLRMEHEGTTRFQLTIGADGKVQSCEITVSSGFASLDRAACNNLKKRGKFSAATDSTGAAVPGTYSSAVVWSIPKE